MANVGVSVIEVRAGTSDQPVKELRPGVQLAPTSVGRSGMWRVDAPGVLDVHAYVYFDGQALFLQSADPTNPAKSNGQTIGAAWQQVEIPCTIEIGRARLVYRTLDDGDDDDKTVARPVEHFDASATPAIGSPAAGAPAAASAMHFRPGGGALATKTEEEEKTRFAPMDFQSGGGPAPQVRQPEPTVVAPIELSAQAPKARPAAGAPPAAWGDQPGQGSTAAGPPPAPQQQPWGNVQVQDPNMMQPGMMQPGMMQPGMMQPGMMQQGMQGMPPGMMQPGMQGMQPGMMQPGMMQPGMQPGMMQPGMMQPGMMQPGMMQPGMMQPGMQPGMMMPGMMPGASGQMPAQPGHETGKVVTATGPASPWDKVKKDWQETSFIKKGMLILMPMIGLLMWNLYGNEEPPPPPGGNGPVGSAMIEAGAPTSSVGSTGTGTGPVGTGPVGTVPVAMTGPTTTGVIANPVPAMPLDGGLSLTTPKDAGARTADRVAADAVAAGNYAQAIQIYDGLIATTQPGPQQDAYKVAAAILRQKVDGG